MRRRDILLQARGPADCCRVGRATARAEESTPFDGATVRNLARDLAQQAVPGARCLAAGHAEEPGLPGLPLDPVRSRPCAVARPGAALHRRVLPSRLPLQGARSGSSRSPTAARADPLQPGPVHLRQGEAADRRHRLRRLPPALSDQPPRLFRRDLRLPRRQLFPRGGEGPGLRPVGARPGDQDRRSRRRGVPAVPRRSGWSGRRKGSDAIVVHALLDSPSAAAAFRFTIRPGEQTVFDTEMALYPRADLADRRHRAAHLDVPVRRQRPHARRRLPRRGARFERAAAVDRQGRADLAAARQSARRCRSAPSPTAARAASV